MLAKSLILTLVAVLAGCSALGPSVQHSAPFHPLLETDRQQIELILDAIGGVGELDIVTVSRSYEYGSGRITKRSLEADGTLTAFVWDIGYPPDRHVTLSEPRQIYSVNSAGLGALFRAVVVSEIIDSSQPVNSASSTAITLHFIGDRERVAVQYAHEFGVDNVAAISQLSAKLEQGGLTEEDRLLLGDDITETLSRELSFASEGMNGHRVYQFFVDMIDLAAEALAKPGPVDRAQGRRGL